MTPTCMRAECGKRNLERAQAIDLLRCVLLDSSMENEYDTEIAAFLQQIGELDDQTDNGYIAELLPA